MFRVSSWLALVIRSPAAFSNQASAIAVPESESSSAGTSWGSWPKLSLW